MYFGRQKFLVLVRLWWYFTDTVSTRPCNFIDDIWLHSSPRSLLLEVAPPHAAQPHLEKWWRGSGFQFQKHFCTMKDFFNIEIIVFSTFYRIPWASSNLEEFLWTHGPTCFFLYTGAGFLQSSPPAWSHGMVRSSLSFRAENGLSCLPA